MSSSTVSFSEARRIPHGVMRKEQRQEKEIHHKATRTDISQTEIQNEDGLLFRQERNVGTQIERSVRINGPL